MAILSAASLVSKNVSDRSFYTNVIPSHPADTVDLQVIHLESNAAYQLEVYRTGFHANDAYSAYVQMGSPKNLSAAQLAHLGDLTQDLPETDRSVHSDSDGTVRVILPMNSNDAVSVKLACGAKS